MANISNYPNGFTAGVTIRGLPVSLTNPGSIVWVSSSTDPDVITLGGIAGSNGNPGTYQKPYATIAYAMTKVNPDRGDIIMVMPNHTETVVGAGTIACDKAGVSIIGLGQGDDRPVISFTTATTASITVSAPNVTFKNIVFSAGFADIVKAFTPTAKNLWLEDCDFVESAADLNFVSLATMGTTDNQCDGFGLSNCRVVLPDLAVTSLFTTGGDIANVVVSDNYVNLGVNVGNLPIIATAATGKDFQNILAQRNTFIRLNTANPLLLVADTTTANSGALKNNSVRHLDTAGELLVTAGTNISFTNNLCSAAVDTSGYLVPVADS